MCEGNKATRWITNGGELGDSEDREIRDWGRSRGVGVGVMIQT